MSYLRIKEIKSILTFVKETMLCFASVLYFIFWKNGETTEKIQALKQKNQKNLKD